MQPVVVHRSILNIIGIAARTSNHAEDQFTTAVIPGLWQRFFSEGVAERIPHKVAGSSIYGIYTDYESDVNGSYKILIGREVEKLNEVPEGMEGVRILEGKYLVFQGEASGPEGVLQTWKATWSYFAEKENYQRAYTADFELHNGQEKVAIYIAVK